LNHQSKLFLAVAHLHYLKGFNKKEGSTMIRLTPLAYAHFEAVDTGYDS
jgi:hypothetical protein